jgi:arylsulfatase A-like enzyme
MSADWSDGPYGTLESSLGDYGLWLRERGFSHPERAAMDHGVSVNGWKARPWHLAERYHFTNWVTQKAQDFLDRRDPTVPFFLNVSYFHPHGPCTPPQAYWDQYISRELPGPVTAEWSTTQTDYEPGLPVDSWHTVLDEESMHRWRAGYFASITHIDDQIGVLLRALPKNTIVIFTSDHGELLGDHQFIRKTRALEGSARIPFIIRFPESMGVSGRQVRDEPIELMDVMPTCLDAAGVSAPEHVEGSSLLGLLRGETDWREWVHGEMNRLGGANPPTGMHYLTDGRRKYVWEPGIDRELYFDLEADPAERLNLVDAADRAAEIDVWRRRLVERLRHRPEGFVRNEKLVPVEGNTASFSDRIVRAKEEWCQAMGIERRDLLG